MTVTGIEKGWYAVSYNGVSGYVSGDYVALCAGGSTAAEAPAESSIMAHAIIATIFFFMVVLLSVSLRSHRE